MRTSKRAIVVAAATLVATAALTASGQAQLPACAPGKVNPLYCQTTGMQQPQGQGQGQGQNQGKGVQVRGSHLTANVCRSRLRPLHLSETITAASGIRRVSVTLDGRTIKTQSSGHLQLTIGMRNLKIGVHTIKITVVDKAGRKSTRTLHFRICAARRVPTFTG